MGVGHGIFLASLMWSATALAAEAPPVRLTILTENAPPTSMLDNGRASGDGEVIGSGSDKVREVMARTGTAFTMELQPWKRAYTAALERRDTCVFSTTRLPEREGLFKWIGPTDSAEWVLLGRADRHYDLQSLDDARTLRIGTYNGDAREAFLREKGFKVDSAQNDLINPQKLLLGRIDLWAASLRRGSVVLEQKRLERPHRAGPVDQAGHGLPGLQSQRARCPGGAHECGDRGDEPGRDDAQDRQEIRRVESVRCPLTPLPTVPGTLCDGTAPTRRLPGARRRNPATAFRWPA